MTEVHGASQWSWRQSEWPFWQTAKSVPLGWKAAVGMPQGASPPPAAGCVFAAVQGPFGESAWCMNAEEDEFVVGVVPALPW